MILATPVNHENDELLIVNAARVSFDKRHDTFDDEKDSKLVRYLLKHNHFTPFCHNFLSFCFDDGGENIARIGYYDTRNGFYLSTSHGKFYIKASLWFWLEHFGELTARAKVVVSHEILKNFPNVYLACFGTELFDYSLSDPYDSIQPYEVTDDPQFTTETFHVKAPLSIRTQCFKHKVGFVENEMSRRYVTDDPECYLPPVLRQAVKDKKQGSGDSLPEYEMLRGVDLLFRSYERSMQTYQDLLDLGVCPEQARFVLPEGTMTQWYWTANLVDFARMVRQRSQPDAQAEVQEVAIQIDQHLSDKHGSLWSELL